MTKIITHFLILFQLPLLVFAQNSGSLQGVIRDLDSDAGLIGANVMILELETGTATDLEGFYELRNLKPGTYTLRISYIGYPNRDIEHIQINAGIVKTKNVSMRAETIHGKSVLVLAETPLGSVLSAIQERQKSSNMENTISAEEMARNGDSNAADALKRLPGVSVQDSRFPIVRGLGERYTSTQMNNAPLPSPEPDKKSVPLDLFPSALLESIVALKTFTPDLPGVFAGGSINIKTKAYPDERLVNFKLSVSDHSNLYLGTPFIGTYSGKYDRYGYDDGSRALSSEIPEGQILSTASAYRPEDLNTIQWYGIIGQYSRASHPTFINKELNPKRPIQLSFDLGDRYNVNDNLEYGFFTNVVFKNDYKSVETETAQYAYNQDLSASGSPRQNGFLNAYTRRTNRISEYKTNSAVNLSAGLKYRDVHKLKLQHIYTHTSSDKNITSDGFTPNIESGLFISNRYIEKTISNTSLSGSNYFVWGPQHQIEWNINRGKSTRYEPDRSSHNYTKKMKYANTDSSFSYYAIDQQAQKIGYRDYTDGVDKNTSFDFYHELKFPLNRTRSIKLKTGIRFQEKSREFEKRSFAITNSSSSAWQDSILNIFPGMRLGESFDKDNFFLLDTSTGAWSHGLLMLDETAKNAFNGYSASEDTRAAFVMASFPIFSQASWSIQFEGGARYEDYELTLDSYNPVTGRPAMTINGDTAVAKLDQNIVLPSINLIFKKGDKFVVRTAVSQTAGRPEFRELAPIAYQEFYQGEVAIGFPFLKNTEIRNFDLRGEWYPSAFELISAGFFYKSFDKPIEVSMIATPDLNYKTFQNAKMATTYGLELEVRKKLPLPLTKGFGSISFNTTLAESEVSMNDTVILFNGTRYANSASTRQRPLQGQSRAMVNAAIDYHSPSGYTVALAYNSFTRRISSVGVGAVGDIYEFPFHALSFTGAKTLGAFKFTLKIKNILNSKVRFGHIEAQTHTLKLRKLYSPGLTLSLGVKYQYQQKRS